MESNEIVLAIEKIIDDWDPLGILVEIKPIKYTNEYLGEYRKYIKPIILTYLNGQSIFDYLFKLQTELWIFPNEEMRNEIKNVSEQILTCYQNINLRL